MKMSRIIGAVIEGVLFAVFMWIGDKYVLENNNPFYVYVIQAVIFAVGMFLFDMFFNRKKRDS